MQIAVALGGPLLSQTVVESVLTIAGFTTGIILGVFFLGIFTRRVGQRAALAGLLLGLATITAVAFGTRLAWPWYTLVGSRRHLRLRRCSRAWRGRRGPGRG